MKHWGSALFPLSLLLVLTLLTFWLRYATKLDEPARDGRYRHDPDYVLSDVVLRKLDQDGQLEYTLRATEVRHYPDDGATEFVRPELVRQNREDGEPPLTIQGDRARIADDNERVDLYDNVRIYRPSAEKYEEFTAVMDALTIFPDDETAFTKSPVLITQGKSWIKGVGLRVNDREQTYLIESRAVGFMESKYAKGN
jgi:lipopolysaccharide export system protein LptC